MICKDIVKKATQAARKPATRRRQQKACSKSLPPGPQRRRNRTEDTDHGTYSIYV
ncbi:MAG: hypothetical protein K6G81_07625 [Lachnospiraceae bacterium]|nr:hypothetical protein [Lachnospiraceae bacterium]